MDGLIQTRGDVAYVIFDRATLDEATAAGVARYKQKVPGSTKKQSPHWNTVERYNAAAAAGEDFDYLKDPKFLEPIATPPFYAAEIRPATVCFTACGLRIDRDAQVISEAGRPVPGLFAAGESAGGVVEPRYVGSGNSYANCLTFGRVAGAPAARLAMAAP
jgi:succinate dehydrogenase/fumarate reductase flavoprotein subunit